MSASLQFLTDETGHKTAVVLPLHDYERLLEDLDDLSVAAERRDEESLNHNDFLKLLQDDGLVSA